MSEVPTAPIQLKPAAIQVVEVLRQWILTGRLGAGQFIRQEAIAKELGVSRVPVREALVTLEAEGMIVRERYKGAFVAEISMAAFREVYELRELLEVFLFEKALSRITEDHLRRAEMLIQQSDEAETGQDWLYVNKKFHMTLYEPAQLSVTTQTLENLLRRTDRYFLLQQALLPNIWDTSRDEHQEIVDIIRSGDHEAALQAMRQHIHSSADEIIVYLEGQSLAGPVPATSGQDSN